MWSENDRIYFKLDIQRGPCWAGDESFEWLEGAAIQKKSSQGEEELAEALSRKCLWAELKKGKGGGVHWEKRAGRRYGWKSSREPDHVELYGPE